MNWFARQWRNRRGRSAVLRTGTAEVEIEPDEIFLDSSNLPSLDPAQLEGRVERPVSRFGIVTAGVLFVLVVGIFGFRAYDLEVVEGAQYAAAAANNSLSRSLIFAQRGVIYDTNGVELAWNEPAQGTSTPYASRRYTSLPGLGLLLGYVRYPQQDASGNWWSTALSGVAGAEKLFDGALSGTNGSEILEKDALGNVTRQHIVEPPVDGADVTLSIDAKMQSKLFQILSQHAQDNGFEGGAAVIMDVRTGKIVAITSFPEYAPQAMTDGDAAAIASYNADPESPFLFRAVAGAYTPGSIVKPFIATGALTEGVITPTTQIYSDGSISVDNPYDPTHPYVYHDWRYQGWMDVRHGIAYSSDVFFYEIGGGYKDQPGMGIDNINKYLHMFGFGSTTGSIFPNELAGTLSSPAWKAANFDGQPWRLGDTYISSIGQYGTQVTPLQAVRAVAALANGGTLLTPQITKDAPIQSSHLDIPPQNMEIAREGMRLSVTDPRGAAASMNNPWVQVAGKTGTAQLGLHNEWMNAWAVGFWPYDHPRYAFAVVLEHAPAGTLSGAAPAMYPFFQWLAATEPQYVGEASSTEEVAD
ncbi:MAG TPA: penicillin-binding transpeptidase domain-containing protein [Candidatus Paceibacterota bacterium]|nr:penicillin-binding transpeptidase domain-containing protein [Candidatus Paceibacterota bacterium]